MRMIFSFTCRFNELDRTLRTYTALIKNVLGKFPKYYNEANTCSGHKMLESKANNMSINLEVVMKRYWYDNKS